MPFLLSICREILYIIHEPPKEKDALHTTMCPMAEASGHGTPQYCRDGAELTHKYLGIQIKAYQVKNKKCNFSRSRRNRVSKASFWCVSTLQQFNPGRSAFFHLLSGLILGFEDKTYKLVISKSMGSAHLRNNDGTLFLDVWYVKGSCVV